MEEREVIAAMRAGLGLARQADADFGERVSDKPALIVSSIDRAKHGGAPPDEPLDVWAFRAVNAAVSDLACAGVAVAFAQIDLQVPADLGYEDVCAIGRGIRSAMDTLGVELINGNNTTTGPLSLATVAHGWRSPEVRPPGRGGASPGDWLVSSRLPGRFTSALEALAAGDDEKWMPAALLGGVAELQLGQRIVDGKVASALIDANDCLLLTARDLARASQVKIEIDRDSLESEAAAVAWHPSLETMLSPPSGDLALVAAVSDRNLDALRSIFDEVNRTPIILGRFLEGSGEVTVPGLSASQLDELARLWWHAPNPVAYPTEQVRALLESGIGSC